jgi:phospholipase C
MRTEHRRRALRTTVAWRYGLFCGAALSAMTVAALPPAAKAAPGESNANDGNTTTPIKHVIVIIGENRTFDHLFATYKPVNSGESVLNLRSEGVVKDDGTPGPNYSSVTQNQTLITGTYQISPMTKTPYPTLPAPLAGGGYVDGAPPFSNVEDATTYENGLLLNDYVLLTTGGVPSSLLNPAKPDTRIMSAGQDVNHLPPGPYQLTGTNPGQLTYDDYAESPVHRFYQMWQQLDCSKATGCLNDLFAWVEASVGVGSNGLPPSASIIARGYKEGATAMGFYNVQQGDMPYFKMLADTYSMSDNFHQSVEGGTGANHIMLGTGDALWFSDGNGNPLTPPNGMKVGAGKTSGVVHEIENPNPLINTNNWYIQDGYGGFDSNGRPFGGGTYTECADTSQPGVAAIVDYLKSVKVKSNCQAGHYYLLNNYNPGYFGDGSNAYAQINNPLNTVFTIPPSSVKNIGDALLKAKVSFAYFGDQFNPYLASPLNNYVTPDNTYCNICNFFQYSTSIMTNEKVRSAALQDTLDLYNDIMTGDLPAVSFVKPSGYLDGHPASSKVNLLEGFVKKIVDLTQANTTLSADTAIFITMDEGGGYYDSGYVQLLDYFGDGTRIPMIVVSPFSKGGHISHTYTDHVSVLKFIEANWSVPPITKRSRDNLPNPIQTGANPYKPINGPAIGDLTDLFSFPPPSP